ncbi:peptide-methionine (S)-S-oxide reductase MsrA [Leeia oryzae]|uniref:peptide-methionine (S)-S-oxide reductase MsrA n=1 Tax=Leeia oryzae TaxID=356662 RepID=UPI00037B8616|nr:peptide-methionine (S)-S-oxide reductase MsrA [Leeia oryzae]
MPALEIATLGGGCFWCTEAVFSALTGVQKVIPGYTGGHIDQPDYKSVCSGTTGHAEAIEIHYDPAQISFETLLLVFFATHDPTTLNRQGHDIGTQYRSVVYYHNPAQQKILQDTIRQLTEEGIYDQPIVTECAAATTFYAAEAYHHAYYAQNPYQPYCQAVISPKLYKLQKRYQHLLRR